MIKNTKKLTHNYTSELELKSLLIRIKNKRSGMSEEKDNRRINKYIKWHTTINDTKYDNPKKKKGVKIRLKAKIVLLSENTSVDKASYERFGEIILLMIRKILTKPQFSGYTYKDDFYSDAIFKILKYLDNFNHLLISERTGLNVNAFAYISQIIHNSILFILNTKKKEAQQMKKQIAFDYLNANMQLATLDPINQNGLLDSDEAEPEVLEVEIEEVQNNLVDEIIRISADVIFDNFAEIKVIYPKDYTITFDEYNDLKGHLKGKISIIRKKKND